MNLFAFLLICDKENGDVAVDDGLHRGVQYPFSVNEKVLIKVRILFTSVL